MAFGQLSLATDNQEYADIAKKTFEIIRSKVNNPKGKWNKLHPGTRNLKNFALPMILCNLALEIEHLLDKDYLQTKEIKIEVINEIMNPSQPDTSSEKTLLNVVLCIETVSYSIYRNNVQVLVTHEFLNESPATVQMYYGMQSMFEKETHTLTANGKYVDWTVQNDVSTFCKKEYPSFRRFIEKNANAYQSSYLFADGLGNYEEITDDDIIFIGNSSNKTYHKIIANREYKKGDIIHWSGVYTWFKSPIFDDNDLLCYEGVIDSRKVLFVDCKKSIDKTIQLPAYYTKKDFTIMEKSKSITIIGNKVTTKGLKITSNGPGSCVIYFCCDYPAT